MGEIKYIEYIAPAFGASILVLGWLTLDTLLRARAWRKKAEALLAQKDGSSPK
jgi:heme exporter protein CcmD